MQPARVVAGTELFAAEAPQLVVPGGRGGRALDVMLRKQARGHGQQQA